MTRALHVLLAAVAVAAAVLSFDALRALALLCGFAPGLAWLLPVVVDAGAAAGSLVWLGGRAPAAARRFARCLALVLLGSSVAANALSHGLAAYGARPAWWVVVLVSGVAPSVLGACVHLAVLCGRVVVPAGVEPQRLADPPADVKDPPADPADATPPGEPGEQAGVDRAERLIAMGAGRRVLARELGIPESQARALLDARRNGSG